jgi:hypothetical protein
VRHQDSPALGSERFDFSKFFSFDLTFSHGMGFSGTFSSVFFRMEQGYDFPLKYTSLYEFRSRSEALYISLGSQDVVGKS